MHQCFLEKILSCISRTDAIWLGFSIGQFTDHLSLYSSQLAFFLRLITSQNQELILRKFRIDLFSLLICFIHNRDRYSLFLKIFEILFRYKYFIPSGILKFLFYLLCLKIFCLDSKKLCFQPQQQIFGYQDHRIFFFLTHPNTHLKNTIVCSVIRKFLRQFHIYKVFFDLKNSFLPDSDPFQKISLMSQLFQTANNFSGIGSFFSFCFFQMIQFFHNHKRNHNPIFLKSPQSIWCLNQYIRINHIIFHVFLSLLQNLPKSVSNCTSGAMKQI